MEKVEWQTMRKRNKQLKVIFKTNMGKNINIIYKYHMYIDTYISQILSPVS